MSDSPALDLSRALLDGSISMEEIKALNTLNTWSGQPFNASNYTAEELAEFREIALLYPEGTRSKENSWEVHKILAKHPDRHELVKTKMDEWQARILYLDYLTNPDGPRLTVEGARERLEAGLEDIQMDDGNDRIADSRIVVSTDGSGLIDGSHRSAR